MRQNLFHLFISHFDYKGGFLSCHDWRPREFNTLADRVCNWVLDRQSDLYSLDLQEIATNVAHGAMLQIHSDGGYDGTSGSAAVVPICFFHRDGFWEPCAQGYQGFFLKSAHSAFHAELVGADAAIIMGLDIGQRISAMPRAKRVRFY